MKEKRYEERLAENNAEKHLVGANEGALARAIRIALTDEAVAEHDKGLWQTRFETVCRRCKKIRDSNWFTNTITVTILSVGVMIGVETDSLMSCDRYNLRHNRDEKHPRCETSTASIVMTILSQVFHVPQMTVKNNNLTVKLKCRRSWFAAVDLHC